MNRYELENGIKVLVDQDSRFACAAVAISCEGGLQDEPVEQLGISHLLEHLLFKRTTKKNTRQIAAALDDLGGEINAFTDVSSLCLFGLVPGSRVTELLDLFRELICENAVTEEDVDIEREIIRQEILEALDDPSDLVFQAMNATLWPDSILRFPVFGTVDSVEKLTLEQVKARLKQILTGKRLTIAVAGNVDEQGLVAAVRGAFGHIPQGDWKPLALPAPKGGLVMIPHPVQQVHFAMSIESPPFAHDASAPAGVFAAALGEGMSSRLFQLLREEQGIAYDVSAQIDYLLNRAVLTISGAVERSNAQMALEFIVAELSKLREESLQKEEMARVIRYLGVQLEFENDSLPSRLWRMVDTDSVLGRYVSAAEAKARIEKVDGQSVRDFITQWLSLRGVAIVLGGNVAGLDIGADILELGGRPEQSQ